MAVRPFRPPAVVALAWLMYAVSWFLPVLVFNQSNGLIAGVETLSSWRSARRWRLIKTLPIPTFGGALAMLSALTSPLFLVSAWVVFRASRTRARVGAWIALAAFALNSQWSWLDAAMRKGLPIGYFRWWFSFLVLAIALFDLCRRQSSESPSPACAQG